MKVELEQVVEAASEYRIAYEQLLLIDKKIAETLLLLENDRRLAEKRYQAARAVFVALALEGGDDYLADREED